MRLKRLQGPHERGYGSQIRSGMRQALLLHRQPDLHRLQDPRVGRWTACSSRYCGCYSRGSDHLDVQEHEEPEQGRR